MGVKNQQGIVTLELLIALVLIVGVALASIALIFDSQTIAVDSQNNHEALLKAQKNLEDLRAVSKADFNSITATPAVNDPDDIYTTETEVNDYPCEKQITSKITWQSQALRPQQVSLATALNNLKEIQALGLDCGPEVPSGDWQHPVLAGSANFGANPPLAGDIDILNNIAFVGAGDAVATKPDLYIYNLSNPLSPALLYSLDTGSGINSLDAVLAMDGNYYIYAAHNSASNQLQVIKFGKDLSAPPVLTASISLPGITGSFPQGRSIFYYDGKVYVATHRTAGKELQVYDVSANPASPVWKGSLEINHNINELQVRKQNVGGAEKVLVYMATSGNADDLIVVDATDAAHMSQVSAASKDLPGNEDARSLFVSGNKLYLGRYKSTLPADADFYILDISRPDADVPIIDSKNLQAKDINSIYVSGDMAFLATGDPSFGLKILNVGRGIINPLGTFSLAQNAGGLDFEDNTLYSTSQLGNALRIIKPQP